MSSNKPTDFQSRRKPDRSLSEASSVRAGLGRRSDQLPAQLQASTMQTASTRRGSSQRSYAKLPPSKREACRSEEHTSELQSLMRISYAVFCLKKKKKITQKTKR